MNALIFDYRDPLLSIIIVIFLVFMISFLTYSYAIFKERVSRKEYRKLLKRFELGNLQEEDYVHLYKTYNLPFDSIILLASTFLYKGEYDKAISVYQALLEHVSDRVKKEELLELLGKTYFKGGFLQRSKDIFLNILKFSPRNKEALEYLLYIYEKFKDYEGAIDVLDSLEEIDVNVKREKIYAISQNILDDSIMPYEKKTSELYVLFKENDFIERLFITYLLTYNKSFFWEYLIEFDSSKCIDLLWYLDFNDINFDKIPSNSFLEELYSAKGYINKSSSSKIFEFDILIKLRKANNDSEIKADLNFNFTCSKCKRTYPIYETRCPNCHDILSFKVKPNLARRFFEKNQSLQ